MIYFTAHLKFLLFAILFFGTAARIFAAEGDLDASFDGDGIVITDNGSGSDAIRDLVVQPDGKIIALGSSKEQNSPTLTPPQTVIVRYNPNGSIDSTFGMSGKVIFQSVFPAELALQSNGKIILGGYNGVSPNSDFYVARLNSDGSLDAAFNGTGAITLDLRGTDDRASSVKIQADGKIVVGGDSARSASESARDYAIVRFNADGSLDTAFDGDGKVFTPLQETSGIRNIAIQPDGKIVAVGAAFMVETPGGNPIGSFATVRYNSNGSIDTTFNGNGIAFTQFVSSGSPGNTRNNTPETVIIRTGGKILVVGTTSSCCGPQPLSQVAMIQYNSDGSLDSSFGTAGKTQIGFSTYPITSANDAAVQADNKIVITGVTQPNIKASPLAVVGRFNANGLPDPTFSGDGWNTLQFPANISSSGNAIAIQQDGKILIGGSRSGSGISQDFIIARFEASSCAGNCPVPGRARVADFDGDGKSDVSVFRPSNGYWYISKSSGGYSFLQWGISDDTPVPGDYDGDGKTDLAVYRRKANNTYYILRSSDNTFTARQLGKTGFLGNDTPAPADYDGDGKTDLAVYTGSDAIGAPGDFIIIQSSTNTQVTRQWGLNTDRRVVADYDGDGKDDLAVYRYRTFTGNAEFGTWYIQQSTNGATRVEYFGLSTDSLVPGDYDGDGKADIAVWRPSSGYWYWISSRDKSFNSYQFGLPDDKPTPADYDGDGKTDFAVFRPSNGVWYLQQSSRGFRAEPFGLSTDIPIPNVFVH